MSKPLIIVVILFVSIIYSCDSKPIQVSKSNIQFDIKDSVLIIDNTDGVNLSHIRLKSKNNSDQFIVLKKNFKIAKIVNVVNCPLDTDYVNTWIALDEQGNFIFNESYYYSTFLSTNDSIVFVNCFLRTLLLDDRFYVLAGDYDENFNLVSDKVDTIQFDKDIIASIPVKNWSKGANNIRFIIVEEQAVMGTLKQKKTFVNKDFFLK